MFFFFLFFIVCISGFLAARTSFFATILALFYLLFNSSSKFKLLILGFPFVFLLTYALSVSSTFQAYQGWFLSFFLLLENTSASHLVNDMYFYPGDLVFLFGQGYFNNSSSDYTDSGYMKDILYGGVLFLAIKMLFLMYFISLHGKRYLLFSLFILVSILIFNFKGAFIYSNAQGMSIFYFTLFYLYKLK